MRSILVRGILCACLGAAICGAARADLTLAASGKTEYQIGCAANQTPTTDYAIAELQRWLKEITGADFPRTDDGDWKGKPRIVLFELAPGAKVDGKVVGPEGYALKTEGPALLIMGGSQRGILYGVYGLLEDHFGCHWFTPEVSSIPKTDSLVYSAKNSVVNPPLEFREPFVKECFDGDWSARNRCNGTTATLEEKHGGKIKYNGFVHTFDGLVPPTKYFDEHPEYFALVGGKRIKDRTQLCTTNPDVIRLVTEGILKRIEEMPEATVFSVSQNDWFYYCECDKCQAIAKEQDSQIGPVLAMVNQVAKAVAAKYPDKLVDTLAYQWTRKPPKTMRPEPNVIVRLCSIECCFSHSFTKCDSPMNKEFVKDVEGWSKICNRLWVWDYTTTFAAYVTPFPNLRVRADNIRFFVDHNVTGIFEQDVYNTTGGEFNGLSGYLGAKLLWDPKYDPEKAINDYLNGVYGAAAPHIRAYLDALHDKVEKDNIHVTIGASPEDKYLTDEILAKADTEFDLAEQAVVNDPATLQRVRIARMSTDYASIEHIRHDAEKIGQFDHQKLIIRPKPEFAARINRFIEAGKAVGITQMREQGLTWEDYIAPLPELLKEEPLTLLPAQSPKSFGAGLYFLYYPGHRATVDGMAKGEPARTGRIDQFGINDIGPLDPSFGVVIRGLLRVQRSGIYSFHLQSNDGSALYIDGQKVINNDGDHKLLTKSGNVALAVGLHPITVRYFQQGGDMGLSLEYQGPEIPKQPIPKDLLFFDAAGEMYADKD